VIGSLLPAAELAAVLCERCLGDLAGTLVTTPEGTARVRWTAPHDDRTTPR